MEKDIGRVPKNQDTDIVVRIDDFGGKIGLTIREFVKSERFTGFTKAGTRIAVENFSAFKNLINSIDEKEFAEMKPSEESIEKSKAFLAKKSFNKPGSKPAADSELEF
jgi:hypothetical protein